MNHPSLHDCDLRRPAYTVGTLVNDQKQWAAMRESFVALGFGDDCEFIAIQNPTCGYRGLNEILARARGRRVILCHQDVRLIGDGRAELDRRLDELDAIAPDWAVAGNAGGIAPGALAIRITDPHGADRRLGTFPQRVSSLDENFMVVNAGVRIGFSRDLAGFHLYGADICMMAEMAGCSAHVIDFHLHHLSPGRKDESFARAAEAFRGKWERVLRPRWLQTTCTLLRIDGGRGAWIGRMAERGYSHLLRRRARTGTWTERQAPEARRS
jgi:hypothetical protein